MSSTNPRLPSGSVVLVTGATGFVGSATSEELLKRGYKVRGATRDVAKTKALAAKFDKLYGAGQFEAVAVPGPEAYGAALKGVAGVIHIASDTSFSPDTEELVNGVRQATVGLLEAAAKVDSVKAFVLTSSVVAISVPEYGKDHTPSLDTYADWAYPTALSMPADSPMKPVLTYVASKVEGEKAAWNYIKTNKPGYTFNTVLPGLVTGPVANPAPGNYSTGTLLTELFNGNSKSGITGFLNPSDMSVDVRDVAILHVAALIDGETDQRRIWARGSPGHHINDYLAIWRKAYPERASSIPADYDFPEAVKTTVDNSLSDRLLHRYAGRSYVPFEESVIDTVKGHEA